MAEKDMKKHPVDVFVGKKLSRRRHVLGNSRSDLGKALGVSFQRIQTYERGTNRIRSSHLCDLAKILTVPVSYFFEGFPEWAEKNQQLQQIEREV